jgi:UDP-N-acetylmuramoylalanine--D-glutamate ligase
MSSQLIQSLKDRYSGKKILVVGLGLQGGGVGIARFFSELGGNVTVTDKKDEAKLLSSINKLKDFDIKFHLGGHKLEDFLEADIIFKGPSVPWSADEIVQAQKKGVPVEMELSFVVSSYPGKVIGITGTRGKSTTTQLIFNIMKKAGFNVSLGGGLPGISTIACLWEANKGSWLVAELSSWALSGFHQKKLSPHIGVLTNLYPDHLNYYKNLDEYFYDKQAIFRYQKKEDFLVVNESIKTSINSLGKIVSNPSTTFFSKNDFPYTMTYLKGDHNLENAAAALKVSEILKIDKNLAVETIKNFNGLPYRLQIIGKKGNVSFINDTTSTTPIATIKAVQSLNDKKIILFLGGNSKNLPKDKLIDELGKVEKIVLLSGSFTDEITPELMNKYSDKLSGPFNDLKDALEKGYDLSKDQDEECYLLFSPGATSFAMFNNEFHRGEEFNRLVQEILNSK